MENFDVAIVGSGPAGYVCAIRCSQLGLRTALVEKYSTLGGTCLNVGCIPSKALLESSERYYDFLKNGTLHGIECENLKINLPQMMSRVAKVVEMSSQGVQYLMKKNKISLFQGHATIQDKNTLKIDSGEEKKILQAERLVLATGSKPASLPGVSLDRERIITSTEALKLGEIPQHLLVIGCGAIGLELGSVYGRLGAKVSVVEYLDSIIPTMDASLGKELSRILKKQGFQIYTGHQVLSVERREKKILLKAQDKKENALELEGDYCLVAVGRKAYTKDLGLENIGIQTDDRGRIPVNENKETSLPGVFAIGDVIEGPMLAHKAEEEGIYVAEYIKGLSPHLRPDLIPGVVYTWPEVAGVGSREDELVKKNIPYKTGSFSFKASGRARAGNENDGMIKVLCHKESDKILGVHMIGPRVADLIAEAVLAMEEGITAEKIGKICHAHPTYSEVFKEACLSATANRALHI